MIGIRNAYKVFITNVNGRVHFGDLVIGGRLMLERWDLRMWTGLS
jgi:hypothetical protein